MAHAADNVHIPDAPLHACINGELVQTPDAQITVMQVESLTMLFCYDEGVVAVTDLSLLDGNIPAEWFS